MRAAATGIRVRAARTADLPELVDIYNHYVLKTAITFDTRAFSVDERRAWFDGFASDGIHRLLVAECDESGHRLAGYASSSALKARAAYDRSVETTIYLRPALTGAGIGGILYAELISGLAADPRLHRAYGAIALPNDASVALHEKLGFSLVGTCSEAGFKFDRYFDVAWYEKDLSKCQRS